VHYGNAAPARPWQWLSFFAGVVVGLIGCVILALGLDLIMTWGGRKSGNWSFAALVLLLTAFAACNVILERRWLESRGYATGLLIALGVIGLCFGMCAAGYLGVH
jgi:hypothetical protein